MQGYGLLAKAVNVVTKMEMELQASISGSLSNPTLQYSSPLVVMPKFGSEPRFEPEPLGPNPKFGSRFRAFAEPNPRSSSRFSQS